MRKSQTHRTPLERRTPVDGYQTTLSDNLPALDALFEKLAANEHPDFWAVMAGLSEMVAFYTNPDQNPEDHLCDPRKMSEKKCRFCS